MPPGNLEPQLQRLCVNVCVRAPQCHGNNPRQGSQNLFAERKALPESDNAVIVFMVFQGIELKEVKLKQTLLRDSDTKWGPLFLTGFTKPDKNRF